MATSGNQQKNLSIKGSDFVYDLLCKPCHLDDIAKPAFGYCTDCDEHLCSMCYVNHKKSRPSRHHKLLDSSSMPQTQTLDDTDTAVSDSLTTPCVKHSQKCIEYYCNDHKVTLCSVCVTLNHTKPCKVDYIPDISKTVLNSDILREIIARARSIEVECDSVKNRISQDTQQTIASLKKSQSDLKKYRNDLNKKLDNQEMEISKKITDLTVENNNKVKTTGTKCDVMKADTQLQKDTLNQMNKSKQPNQLFIEMHQTRKILDECEDSLQSIDSQHHRNEYQFTPNTAILEAENVLGTISSQQQVMSPSTHSNIPPQRHQRIDIKPTYKDEILVKTSGDQRECWITGITEIVPDILVLADFNNQSIKLVDVRSKLVTSTLRLEHQPWDITTISTTEVAVTIPDGQYIQFVTVSNKLKKSRRINTNGYCHGICYHQDKLIVTCWNPSKLEILDMKGKVIKSITTDTTGKHIFSSPIYVQATDTNIYISDLDSYTILMVDYNGIVISRCEVMDPYGLAVLKDSSILICSWVENKLYQLTGDIKKCTVMLQDVESPEAICVNHKHSKLYISGGSYSDNKKRNNILVWNM